MPPAATPIGIVEIVSGLRGIFRGQKELDRFQSELKAHFGVKHCVLVSSGKAAFTLILLALKELFPERDEVIIPAFTCYSVPSSVIRAGLKTRLCDLHPDSFDLDLSLLSSMLLGASGQSRTDAGFAGSVGDSKISNKRLLTIVPTHLFGFSSDITGLRKLLRDPDVTIVEDAAQAMGGMHGDKKLGTLGDVSFFSLGRGKPFSTVEGGIILTNRDDIAEILNRRAGSLPVYGPWQHVKLILKATALLFFTRPSLFWIPRSLPFLHLGKTFIEPHFPILRMSSFQAGLTVNWRKRLQRMQETRRSNVQRWLGSLESGGDNGLSFQYSPSIGLLRFPVRILDVRRRESLLRQSTQKGAGIMPVYPESINRLAEVKSENSGDRFPVAESCARELVTLPTHEYITQKDVAVIRGLLSQVSIE